MLKFDFDDSVMPFFRVLMLGSTLSLGLLQPALAGESEAVGGISECRVITDAMERLRCYDAFVDSAGGRVRAPEASGPVAPGSDEMPAVPSAGQLSVTIVRVDTAETRNNYFHTADGAVWKQTGRGSWSIDVPFTAIIKPGVLGSFFLVTEGGKSTRVKRVR